jgi:hypothetical protein
MAAKERKERKNQELALPGPAGETPAPRIRNCSPSFPPPAFPAVVGDVLSERHP